MLSQLFILSARGDTIINRDFRGDLVKNTPEIFFRQVKTYTGDSPPLFNIDGVSYGYLKKDTGLYVVAATRSNISPSYMIEILNKLVKILKDFCGVLTEESIRKNFILIYEIIDEVLDFGYAQLTSTELIKPMIASEAVLVKSLQQTKLNPTGINFNFFNKSTKSATASMKPVTKMNAQATNEIFVDVFEKLNMLFNSSGYMINSSIDGYIQMKSYLAGNPELRMSFNEGLMVGRQEGSFGGGPILDDCNFNECVDAKNFTTSRTLRIKPPEGEFMVMGYRINADFQPPFRLFPYIDEINNFKIVLDLRVKADFPKDITSSFITVKIPVPKNVNSVTPELVKGALNQTADYKSHENQVIWTIKQCTGKQEIGVKVKISLPTGLSAAQAKKEIGPITLQFEISNYNLSRLQIKALKVDEFNNKVPIKRWMRYVTQAASYVCRCS